MGLRKHRDIEVRGTVYPTVQACAAALGVSQEAVYWAIRDGNLPRLGLGCVGRELIPIRIRGQRFASAAEAAAHFGVKKSAIYQAIAKNRLDRVGQRTGRTPKNARGITICGHSWPSMAALSRELGKCPEFVSFRIRRGQMPVEEIAALIMRRSMAPQGAEGSQAGRGSTRAKGAGWATGKAA